MPILAEHSTNYSEGNYYYPIHRFAFLMTVIGVAFQVGKMYQVHPSIFLSSLCGFLIGLITGYAIKKVIRLAAVIVGLFIAALAYLEYQRILNVDWHKVHAVSQSGIDWIANALTHVSSTIGTSHTGTLSNIGIPLLSSVSAGFVL